MIFCSGLLLFVVGFAIAYFVIPKLPGHNRWASSIGIAAFAENFVVALWAVGGLAIAASIFIVLSRVMP